MPGKDMLDFAHINAPEDPSSIDRSTPITRCGENPVAVTHSSSDRTNFSKDIQTTHTITWKTKHIWKVNDLEVYELILSWVSTIYVES